MVRWAGLAREQKVWWLRMGVTRPSWPLPRRTPLAPRPEPVFDRLAELTRRVVGVPTALVTLVDQDRQVFPGAAGLAEPLLTARQAPLTQSLCRFVVAGAEPVVVRDTQADPALALLLSGTETVAYAGVPLVNRAGEAIGSLCAIDSASREWTEEQLADLRDLAVACSAELQLREATQLVEVEVEQLQTVIESMPVAYLAYDADWRVTAANAEAARIVDSTVPELVGHVLWDLFPATVGTEFEVIFRRVRETGAPEVFEFFYPAPLSKWYEIRVQRDPSVVAAYFVDTTERHESEVRAETILNVMPVGFVGLDQDFRITAANSIGAELVGSTVEALVGRIVWDLFPGLKESSFGETYQRVARTGHSELIEAYYPAPLDAWYDVRAASVVGGVSLFYTDVSERHRNQQRLEEVAAHERTVAHTLQQALLSSLPSIPGAQIASRYLTAEGTDQVGGDWYDAVAQPTGALAVTVGDVCGHGVEAAAAMGQLRSMLRGFTWDDTGTVAASISRLDKAASGHGGLPLATLVSGRIEGLAGPTPATLRWSNAGHPPPLLLTPDGTLERLDGPPELMLGVHPGAPRTDHTHELPPGSTLLLYTDGLVETRSASVEHGIDRLSSALLRHRGLDLEGLLDHTIADLRDGVQDDDIAILAVRLDPTRDLPPETEVSVDQTLTLIPDLTAPGVARAVVNAAAVGLDQELVDRAVLLTSEVVTNAVRHGKPEISLRVVRDPRGLEIAVRDGGAGAPVSPGQPEPTAIGGRGVSIIEALATRWGVARDEPAPGKVVWFRVDLST